MRSDEIAKRLADSARHLLGPRPAVPSTIEEIDATQDSVPLAGVHANAVTVPTDPTDYLAGTPLELAHRLEAESRGYADAHPSPVRVIDRPHPELGPADLVGYPP